MELSEENFELYAAHYYDAKRSCSFTEFQNDLKKITYIKKLLVRFEKDNDLQVRLILNHIIIFLNCFGSAGVPMLFMKLEEHHSLLKPFLMFIGYLPKRVIYNGRVINSDEIPMNQEIINELRKI